MGIFNVDGGLMKTLTKVTDCICLSLLFLVSCLPIFTIGTAATALYYTVHKVIRHDRGYILKNYMSSFKENFKQTTPIWLLMIFIFFILSLDIYIMDYYAKTGSKLGILTVFFLAAAILMLAWSMYLFPYIARFENTRKQCMKNAAIIAIANLPRTLLLSALIVAAAFIVYIIPVSVLIVPGLFTWIQTGILEKVFRKYMSEEDREKEDELNREYKN